MTFDIRPVLLHYAEKNGRAVTIPEGQGNRSIVCPLHDDRVKSGSVDLTRHLYNCFSCSADGDAIKIIMDQEGLDFLEAKRFAEGITESVGGEVPGGTHGDLEYLPGRSRNPKRDRRYVPNWTRR